MGQMLSFWDRGKDIFYGKHEVEEFVGEADNFIGECNKEDGHRHMIPVYVFTPDHLPEPYNKMENIYKLTLSIAYLTVRLKTQYISNDRPDFIPGTENSYPFHDKKGQRFYTTGSGRVCDVVKNTRGKCTCKKCLASKTPSKLWWSIKIFTATHVVFDDTEAKGTTICLFYDDQRTEESRGRKVDLFGCKRIWLDVSGDLCLLETATCDKQLAEELFAEIKNFNTFWKSLKYMYERDKKKEQLVIIVSHPHGGEKRISVGKGVDIGNLHNLGYSKYIYTTPTCPGTSGAPVYILGYDWFLTEYVHGGTVNNLSSTKKYIQTTGVGLESDYEIAFLSESNVLPLSYSTAYVTPKEMSPNNVSNNDSNVSLLSGTTKEAYRSTEEVQEQKSTTFNNIFEPLAKFHNYSARWM